MKNLVIVLAVAAMVALGGLSFNQHQQLTRLRTELAEANDRLVALEDELAEKSAGDERIALAERKAKVLQETLSQASAVSADQSKQVSELEQSLASAKTNSTGLAGLFKSPEMREMIKTQQKAFMGPMIDKNYAALFSQLNLSPEQAGHVNELLEQKMLTAADMGMSMMDGSLDAEKRKELAQKVKDETAAFDQQIKDFLGEDAYKTFQDYEKGLPDRMSTGQFRDQVANSGNALDAQQEEQLMAALSEARKGFTWSTDYNNQNPGDVNFKEMFSPERLDKHFAEQSEFDRQLVDRAKAFMRPDQLAAYEKFLENQRNMQKAAMGIARDMFGN